MYKKYIYYYSEVNAILFTMYKSSPFMGVNCLPSPVMVVVYGSQGVPRDQPFLSTMNYYF